MSKKWCSSIKSLLNRRILIIILVILFLIPLTQTQGQENIERNGPENFPPVSNPQLDYIIHSLLNYVEVLEVVHFVGTESYDPNPEDNLTYNWDFGDGATSNLTSPKHVYKKIGEYTVTLIVNDTKLSDRSTLNIVVISLGNRKPIALITTSAKRDQFGNIHININEPISFNANESYDPEGFPLVNYEWNFGDGQSSKGENDVVHEFSDDGTYTIVLTVVDEENLFSLDTINVVVGTGESSNNNKKEDDITQQTTQLGILALVGTVIIIILLLVLWMYLKHARKSTLSDVGHIDETVSERPIHRPRPPPQPEFARRNIQEKERALREARIKRMASQQQKVKKDILKERIKSERKKVDADMKKELEDMGIEL